MRVTESVWVNSCKVEEGGQSVCVNIYTITE